MSDNKKYYYMRLKENFFDSDEMLILESLPEGYLYSNILLKMYLRSLKCNGMLLVNECIPYNAQMISTITKHPLGTVKDALNAFQTLGLIDILDNGTIYMSNVELLVGQSSTEGERKKKARLELKKKNLIVDGQASDICPPEIEIELEKEKETDTDTETETETERIQSVDEPSTQDRIGKDRIGKDRLGEDRIGNTGEVEYFPDEKLNQTFIDFINMRKKIKAPMTDRAIELAGKKLLNLANNDNDTAIAILEQSIMNSWKGLFPVKEGAAVSKNGQSIDDIMKL